MLISTKRTLNHTVGAHSWLTTNASQPQALPTSEQLATARQKQATGGQSTVGPVHLPYNSFFSAYFFSWNSIFFLTTNQSTVFFSRLISSAVRGLARKAAAMVGQWLAGAIRGLQAWLGAGLVAKIFAKWYCIKFRCYLKISVQSWSN
jgi:hypothetical protein